uniref:Knr4/Smi1-like domain-containing protein n=1 Tax=Ananas comosus var. bracteatus TaxID=296719 RepID=A0A6V7PN50_ANACO|nr:unnamed protein product [Ananas comosus var. bracteatus]
MVDVDRRTPGLPPAHAAGLRRLSSRAAAGVSSSSSGARAGLLSFSALAESLLSHLRSCGVPVLPGLSDAELLRLEAELGLSFPPDLRALLSLGLPSAPGFPDWRSPLPLLLPSLRLPSAALALHVARRGNAAPWPRSLGPRPPDPAAALRLARSALRRAPPLIPLFRRCYLPALPALAGNPVFRVDDDGGDDAARVSCCAADLADFFRREAAFRSDSDSAPALPLRRQLSAPIPPPPPPSASSARRSLDSSIAGKKPRWIEFWSDAALDRRARASSASSHPPIQSSSSRSRSKTPSLSLTLASSPTGSEPTWTGSDPCSARAGGGSPRWRRWSTWRRRGYSTTSSSSTARRSSTHSS